MKVVIFESTGSEALDLPSEISVHYEPTSIEDSFYKYSDAEVFVVFATHTVKKKHIPATLKLLYTRSAGTDHIECKDYLESSGVELINDNNYSTNAVAEYVLKHIFLLLDEIQPRQELAAKRVAIIGNGNIGKLLTDKLTYLSKSVKIYSSVRDHTKPRVVNDVSEALNDADIILVVTALTPLSRKILNPSSLNAMKKGAKLISISRSGVFNTEFIAEGLKQSIFDRVVIDDVGSTDEWRYLVDKNAVTYTEHTAWCSQESLEGSYSNLEEVLLEALHINR